MIRNYIALVMPFSYLSVNKHTVSSRDITYSSFALCSMSDVDLSSLKLIAWHHGLIVTCGNIIKKNVQAAFMSLSQCHMYNIDTCTNTAMQCMLSMAYSFYNFSAEN